MEQCVSSVCGVYAHTLHLSGFARSFRKKITLIKASHKCFIISPGVRFALLSPQTPLFYFEPSLIHSQCMTHTEKCEHNMSWPTFRVPLLQSYLQPLNRRGVRGGKKPQPPFDDRRGWKKRKEVGEALRAGFISPSWLISSNFHDPMRTYTLPRMQT